MSEWLRKFLRVEPGISLAQWLYDRIYNHWERIVAAFIAGGGMSYLASITQWMTAWGPVGIGGAGLLAGVVVWVGLAGAASLRAKAQVRRAQATAIEKWKEKVDAINPLAPEFHTKRISLADLPNPITRMVSRKRFIDCELIGPANIMFRGRVQMSGVGLINCDTVVMTDARVVNIHNVIAFEDVTILGGTIGVATIFIPRPLVPQFAQMGAEFLTMTGDAEIDKPLDVSTLPDARSDTQLPLDIAEKTRP